MSAPEIVSGVLALLGAGFVLLSGAGVLRFPDLYARMHAATKASTIAVLLVATSAAVALDEGTAKVLLAAVLIFVTAPSGAHLVGRSAYRAEGIDLTLEGPDDLREVLGPPDDPPVDV